MPGRFYQTSPRNWVNSMTNNHNYPEISTDGEFSVTSDEVPCLDDVSPEHSDEVNNLRSCILNRLRRHCAKNLMGPWANTVNVEIREVGGGLSNYLYVATLKPEAVDKTSTAPRKVFVRVYGELLRSNMNSIILDAVLFALLSEKRLGPKLHGVFPGGRIEEFVESRTLKTVELACPSVRDCVALHMGVLHSLTLPLPKMPTFLFKTMAKFIQQLTGTRQPPARRPRSVAGNGNCPGPSGSSNGTGPSRQIPGEAELPDDVIINNPPPGSLATSQLFGSTSSIGSVHEPQPELFRFANEWRLVEQYEWLRRTFFTNLQRFPVRFCHNDVQENNLLLYKDPSKRGWYRILPIDYEYGSYNFRCIDIGNFFNEWTYDNAYPQHPGFAHYPDAYPSREDQLAFWRKYLAVYNYMENGGFMVGTYIQQHLLHGRRAKSQSVSVSGSILDVKQLLRLTSPPSAPVLKPTCECGSSENTPYGLSPSSDYDDREEEGEAENANGEANTHASSHFSGNPTTSLPGGAVDPALRCLSELEEIRELPQVELTPEEEDALLVETIYGALFSHLWWAIWSLIQSQISSIGFGFVAYAESRMMAYYKLKRTLPASEFENGESQRDDAPTVRLSTDEVFSLNPSPPANGERTSSATFFVVEDYD